jgi:hypothetical protein
MTDQRPRSESEIVEFVRSIDVKAPDSLHRQIESMIAERGPAARRRRRGSPARAFASAPRLAAAGAIVAAAAAVAIVLGSSGGGSSGLSARAAAALTLRPATQAAPRESQTDNAELAAAVEGVSFPYWEGRLGWRSVGARSDRAGGRAVKTVFYADRRGRRVGYAIVAGSPAPRTSGGHIFWRHGTPYRISVEGGVPVVTWLRDGHLCVVSGRGVSSATLLRLASWVPEGSIAS